MDATSKWHYNCLRAVMIHEVDRLNLDRLVDSADMLPKGVMTKPPSDDSDSESQRGNVSVGTLRVEFSLDAKRFSAMVEEALRECMNVTEGEVK